jgi:hypothetical protein
VLLTRAVTYIEAVVAPRTSYAIPKAATAPTVFLPAVRATAAGPVRRAVRRAVHRKVRFGT